MNEVVLLRKGMEALTSTLGDVETERFIAILLRDLFDYTEWRKNNLCITHRIRTRQGRGTVHVLSKGFM
jgi:hypothetical protein